MTSAAIGALVIVVFIAIMGFIGLAVYSYIVDYRKTQRDEQGLYGAKRKISQGKIRDEEEDGVEFEIKGGDPQTGKTVKARINDGLGHEYIKHYDVSALEIENKSRAFLGLESPVWVKKKSEKEEIQNYKNKIRHLETKVATLEDEKYYLKDSVTEHKTKVEDIVKTVAKAKEQAKPTQQ